METNSDPRRTIEDLKEAGEELKEVSPSESDQKEENPQSLPSLATERKEEIDLFKKIAEHQKELGQELPVLEKAYQETKELEKKLVERIESIKKLQSKNTEISKEVKEFEEQLALTKKENKNILNQIKNKSEHQNE